jgi:hypothetical protein
MWLANVVLRAMNEHFKLKIDHYEMLQFVFYAQVAWNYITTGYSITSCPEGKL